MKKTLLAVITLVVATSGMALAQSVPPAAPLTVIRAGSLIESSIFLPLRFSRA